MWTSLYTLRNFLLPRSIIIPPTHTPWRSPNTRSQGLDATRRCRESGHTRDPCPMSYVYGCQRSGQIGLSRRMLPISPLSVRCNSTVLVLSTFQDNIPSCSTGPDALWRSKVWFELQARRRDGPIEAERDPQNRFSAIRFQARLFGHTIEH